MSSSPRLGRACALLALVGVGCEPADQALGPDDQGEDCFMYQPPPESLAWPTRELELGTLDEGRFTAWIDGQELPAILGYQGYWMLTPSFALAARAEDGSRECWFVRAELGSPEGEVELPLSEGVYPAGMMFEEAGAQLRAGPLFFVIDEEMIGTTQRLNVSVYGEGFSASESLELSIVAP